MSTGLPLLLVVPLLVVLAALATRLTIVPGAHHGSMVTLGDDAAHAVASSTTLSR